MSKEMIINERKVFDMDMQQFQQLFFISKSGKILVRKGAENEGLISFESKEELSKFLAGFDFNWFMQEEHIITVKPIESIALEYRVYLVEEERDMHHDNYIWKKMKNVKILSNDKHSFEIDISALIQERDDYIRMTDKKTCQILKNYTNEDLLSYLQMNNKGLNLRSNFEKNFILMIINENNQILRRKKGTEFCNFRSLETCLKSYGFVVKKRSNFERLGKHISLVFTKTDFRVDNTYFWDSLTEDEKQLVLEKTKIIESEEE